jgi:hypothetical protein
MVWQCLLAGRARTLGHCGSRRQPIGWTFARQALCFVVMAAWMTGCNYGSSTADRSSPKPHLSGCPVTLANGSGPQGQPPSSDYYGNGFIWTNLWPDGIVRAKPSDIQPDGSIAMKFPWYRGVIGDLRVSGRRLDGVAPPLTASVPSGYGNTGFQSSGLIFPTAGCWQVTGRVGTHTLTFVTFVAQPS